MAFYPSGVKEIAKFLMGVSFSIARWKRELKAKFARNVELNLQINIYSLRFRIRGRLGLQHGHQSTTLTSLFYKNIYWKVIYVYSYESNFQDKSIYMIFTFSNSTT
jgi:hypothetical protein